MLVFFFSWTCSLFCYSFPILDPLDPQYAWMDDLIEQDFANKKPVTRKQLREAAEKYKNEEWYPYYKIQDNRVICSSPQSQFFKDIFEYLCQCYGLPDLELIAFAHDGLHQSPASPVPIFTRARRAGIKNTILLIYGYGFDWVDNMCQRVEAKVKDQSWDSLITKLYWRGNTTDGHEEYGGCYTRKNWMLHPRGKVCSLSLQYPDLLDAKFVLDPEYGLCSEDVIQVLPSSGRVPFETCLDYKYQLVVTGIVAPWQCDWKGHAGRVIFKQSMPWEVYWYPLFKPWEHYIPVAADCSDLMDRILWAAWHDEECQEMARRSRAFMQTHAKAEHMALYCYKALLRYKKLLID